MLDHEVGEVVVHMHLGHLGVTGDEHRLADGLQVRPDGRHVQQLAGPGPEQVDGLVPERGLPVLGRGGPEIRPDPRGPGGGFVGPARRAAARRLEGTLEQAEQALPAGIHHVGLAEDRQQRRRLGDRPFGRLERGREDALHVVVALGGGDGCGARLANDRQDRPLDRLGDGLVRLLGARVERMCEVQPVEATLPREAEGHALQDLAGDDARVPPRAHQRPVAGRLGDALRIGVGSRLVGLLERGPDRGEHVRARVPVRHREDVERVDLVDVRLQAGDGAAQRGEEAGTVAGAARHQATSVPLSARSPGRGSPTREGSGAGARPCSWWSFPMRIVTRSGSRSKAWRRA